jgi:uncharacterized protein (TIGR03382 family)
VPVIRVGAKWARDHDGGKLGATVPAGHHTVTFYYRPRSFVVGAAINGISIPLMIAAWVFLRRRRRQSAATISE